jgi:hypothetical protein
MTALAKSAFLRLGKNQLEILSEDEPAIATSVFLFRSFKRKAIPFEADRAGYKDFFLNC